MPDGLKRSRLNPSGINQYAANRRPALPLHYSQPLLQMQLLILPKQP